MAKTTKSTKRAAPTTKKKSGLSKINFNSRKTQFITAIVIIALMGAGWFTYRSFAATAVFTQSASAYDASSITETKESTGKAQKRVARLSPGESISFDLAGNTLNNSTYYRFCVTTRYENPSASSKPAQLVLGVNQLMGARLSNSGTNFADIRYAALADSYSRECTRPFQGWGRDTARFSVKNNGPSTARVGIVIVETTAPPTPAAPAK